MHESTCMYVLGMSMDARMVYKYVLHVCICMHVCLACIVYAWHVQICMHCMCIRKYLTHEYA